MPDSLSISSEHATIGSMNMDEKNKPKNKRAAFARLVDYLKPEKKSVAIGVAANIGIALLALVPPIIYGKS